MGSSHMATPDPLQPVPADRRLAEVSLHSRASVLDIAAKISPLLCHPNSWVRHGAIGFFASISRQFGDAQVFCFVRPLLRPFLAGPLLSLDPEHLAAALRPPDGRAPKGRGAFCCMRLWRRKCANCTRLKM